MVNVVKKERAASRSYGRGMDNYRTPATYGVFTETGARIGVILGSRAGYMERSSWEVCWLSPNGMPRTVHYADKFADAKAWAEQWDGQAPKQWRQEVARG